MTRLVDSGERLLRATLPALCVLAGLAMATGPGRAGEDVPTGRPHARARRAAEPEPRRGVQAAAESAAAAGQAFDDAPVSPALARALERVATERGSPGEVFALVTVSDRLTGERRITTRGEPRPEYAEWIRHPERAPAGESYAEGEELLADGEVEIATRWIARRDVPRAGPGPAIEEEEEIDQRERNAGSPLGPRIEEGLRRRVVAGEIDLGGAALVPVRIALRGIPGLELPKVHDPASGGLLWAGLYLQAERSRRIIERKADVAGRQRPLLRSIEQVGGRVRHASWLSGSVEAEVPASSLPALAARDDVASVEFVEPLAPAVLDRFTGADYYVATDAEDFDPSHVGFHGLFRKHDYSSRVVVALGEECIDEENPAWRNGGPGSSTRLTTHDCDPIFCDGCCDDPGGIENCEGENSHGTRVAQLMAGDFMDGQEPVLSDIDRRRMTGTCPECKLIFYQDENLNQRTAVLEEVCRDAVDIFESSIGSIAISCDGDGDFDADLEALVSCDVSWIQAAGNEGSEGGCTTVYPADHPWTLTVGGIRTKDPCDSAGAYYTDECTYDLNASHGGGAGGVATIVDLAAPYRFSTLIRPNTSPVEYGRGNGTSFATPMTAGLAAVMLDWWHQHVSESLFFDKRLRTVMLLFGDRTVSSVGPTRTASGYSTEWGAGRVGLVPFDDLNDWGIYRTTYTLDAGESVTFRLNIPNDAPFFKAVVWHDGKDYRNEPQIGLTLSPVNCDRALEAYITSDSKAMLVFPMEAPLDNCTHMDVTIDNIRHGSSGRRRFYFAAYAAPEDEVHY